MPERITDETVLAKVVPSAPRRIVATAMLGLLAVLLVYLAAVAPSGTFVWTFFQLFLGLAAAWLAWRLWTASGRTLLLTSSTLRDSSGDVLCDVRSIQRVERGAFAFKPSNGFLLTLSDPGPRAWNPGLWWRIGRRIGVGGVTSAAHAKAMSEVISAMIQERDGA